MNVVLFVIIFVIVFLLIIYLYYKMTMTTTTTPPPSLPSFNHYDYLVADEADIMSNNVIHTHFLPFHL